MNYLRWPGFSDMTNLMIPWISGSRFWSQLMRVGPLPDIGNEPLSCTRRLKRSRIRTFLGSTDQNNVDKSS